MILSFIFLHFLSVAFGKAVVGVDFSRTSSMVSLVQAAKRGIIDIVPDESSYHKIPSLVYIKDDDSFCGRAAYNLVFI